MTSKLDSTNLGLSFIKVYQLPYESLEKPEEFLKISNGCIDLSTNQCPNTHQCDNSHLDLICTSLFRGQTRTLVPNARFRHQVGGNHRMRSARNAPLPIFVNILKDARFLWVPIIDCIHCRGVCRNLERQGHHALHSMRDSGSRYYACGGEPFLLETR